MKSWKGLAGALTELTGRGIITIWNLRKKERTVNENPYPQFENDGQQVPTASGSFPAFTPGPEGHTGNDPETLRRFTEQIRNWPASAALEGELPRRGAHEQRGPVMPEAPPPMGQGLVDTTRFLRAQARFIDSQTQFLEEPPGSSEFTNKLMIYSRAQNEMIRAQAEVLKQLGVI